MPETCRDAGLWFATEGSFLELIGGIPLDFLMIDAELWPNENIPRQIIFF
jgi:hypothetical protein